MHTHQRTHLRVAPKGLLIGAALACALVAPWLVARAQVGTPGVRVVLLAWDPSPTTNVAYRLLQRPEGGTNWAVAVTTTNTVASVTIPKSTNYTWTVVAFNIWGESLPSNEVGSQFPPEPAGNLRPLSITTTTTTVTESMLFPVASPP